MDPALGGLFLALPAVGFAWDPLRSRLSALIFVILYPLPEQPRHPDTTTDDVIARIKEGLRYVNSTPWQGILGTAFGIAVLAFARAPFFELSVGLAGVAGLAAAMFTTISASAIVSGTDPRLFGRVASPYQLTFALGPLGAIPIAALADRVGASMAVGFAGLLLAVVAPLAVRRLGRGVGG